MYARRTRFRAFVAKLAIIAVGVVVPTVAGAQTTTTTPPKPSRVALVIGNGAYKDAPLPNPVNDAADIARALEASGFTVIRRDNATLRQMHLAVREFGDKLGRGSIGLFYFAGHGVQVRGRNYLLPVDAEIAREDEVSFSAVDLGAVLEKMDTARNPLNLVIIDACRNNPFAARFQLSATGLAQIDAPPGTLIAFATAPGSVAADGTGRNGLYTQHLLAQMGQPGAAVEEVFKAVRAAVRKDSAGRQVPWESTSLETRFAFREAPQPEPARPVEPAKVASSNPRAAPSSLGAPPNFVVGDRWSYRTRNLLTGDDRRFSMSVKEIRGDEIVYDNGTTTDVVGNPIRSVMGGGFAVHTPSAQMLAFPMMPGASWDLKLVQDLNGRLYDVSAVVKVIGPEEIDVPAGRLRALRIERDSQWKERGKDSNSGNNRLTYWYSSGVKRLVVLESLNTTSAGKVLMHERQELESYRVR